MIVMNRWCASYDDFGEETEEKALTSGQRRKQMVVGHHIPCICSSTCIKIPEVISIDPNFIGYAMIAVAVLTTVVTPKEALESLENELLKPYKREENNGKKRLSEDVGRKSRFAKAEKSSDLYFL